MKYKKRDNLELKFESLEERNLLSVTLVDNDLQLIGTNGNDDFDVELVSENEQIAVTASLNGEPSTLFLFAQSDVNGIIAVLHNGDDVLTIDSDIKLPTRIDGGLGNDTIFGRSGNDSVTDDGPGDIRLGDGDDQFTQDAYTTTVEQLSGQLLDDPTILRVDLGAGDNSVLSLTSNEIALETRILNLDGFNVFLNSESGSMRMVQIEDLGDVKIGGIDEEDLLRFQIVPRNSGNETPFDESANRLDARPIENLRVELLDRSRSDIFVSTLQVDGDLHFQLNEGHRDISMISVGADNIRILAGVGENDVTLDGINTQFNLLVDTGSNFDEVFMPCIAGDLRVQGNLVIRNVNEMVAAPIFTGGSFIFDTTNENIPSLLDFDREVNIGNNLVYKGGSSTDHALLNSFGWIQGDVFVFLGESTRNADSIQLVSLGLSINGDLNITGGESEFGTSVQLRNFVRGDVFVSFGNSTSDVFANIGLEANGRLVRYIGSNGNDEVNITDSNRDLSIVAELHNGDDILSLPLGTVISVTADGGLGIDTLRQPELVQYPILDNNFEVFETLERSFER